MQGPIRGVGPVHVSLQETEGPIPDTPVDKTRESGREEEAQATHGGSRRTGYGKRSKGYKWTSLKEHHLKLTRDGYEPPKPKEWPAKYVSIDGRRQTGRPKLKEADIKWVRENPEKLTIVERANRYDMHPDNMASIVKGITYRRWNLKYPPQW